MRVLPVIVVSQFFCTSLWFAGNAVISDIAKQLSVAPDFLGHLSSAVQLGFIAGTLVFALLGIADRFSPSRVFFVSAVIAAFVNLGTIVPGNTPTGLLGSRFMTGFFLAGIYPVGMKIASDYYREGLGKNLGLLIGALVLGTAVPHLLKIVSFHLPWTYVIYATSVLAVIGGAAVYILVPDGPYRQPATKFRLVHGISNRELKAAALGYFGHMWELYAFWTFLPVMLTAYNIAYPSAGINVSLFSFLIIAAGGIACVAGGFLSPYFGVKRTAATALLLSGICCLVSPILLMTKSVVLFIIFLFVWGMTVIADSPLFSTLVATHAPAAGRGALLTIVTSLGFAITIISIQLVNLLLPLMDARYVYLLLAVGPVLGLMALRSKRI